MTAPTARERDAHFRKIVEGLAGRLDPDLFEECVQDLLRADFPGLTGIYGGADGGMDGAIPDWEGEAFPLVVTTAENVIGNLSRSLDRLVESENPLRKVVLATSQALTPRRRENLKRRARERGFTLLQIFERRDLAVRLYRDSRLTQLLLGITGDPPALSAVPSTRRPQLDVDLVGRGEDLEWLRETPGDRLLVGEPGSGKTSLLLRLVRDGRALFLSDIERFAPAFRETGAEIILVDDAHVQPERLDRLRQIRNDVFSQDRFSIVATSWKGGREEVLDALGGLPKENTRSLELLVPSEIVEVYRRVGLSLADDDPYLAELVTQAANRPGLAVTLGRAWLRQEYEEVLSGRAISRSLLPFLKRELDRDPEHLLAAFSLGGSMGMGLMAVAGFLGESPGRVRTMVASVGASGILAERGKDEHGEVVLAVHPPQLRAPLLEKVFFGEFSAPWAELALRAPSVESVVEALLLARNRQVPVPRIYLEERLAEVESPALWATYASSGADEAEWVMRNFPGSVTEIAPQALAAAPRATIRALLREAETESDGADSSTSKSLKVLREWSQEVVDHYEGLMERRRLLVDVAMDYLVEAGTSRVILLTAFFALSPRIESSRLSATGSSVILRHGSLPASSAPEILSLWERVRVLLPRLDLESWSELNDTLHWWIHPQLNIKGADREPFHRVARQMLLDLVPVAKGHRGMTATVLWRAEQVELDLDLDLTSDPLFEVFARAIYQDPRGWAVARQEFEGEARRLAGEWATRPIGEVLDDLSRFREEAKWDFGSSTDLFEFHLALSKAASSPESWLETLLNRRADASLVQDFLGRVVREESSGWVDLLEQALEIPQYSWAAARQVLRLPDPPGDLVTRTLSFVEPQLVETSCHQGVVPTTTLHRLLTAKDSKIALAAAVGEWHSEPSGVVRPEIDEVWREAILTPVGLGNGALPHEQQWLSQILAQDSQLALEWIFAQANGDESGRLHPGLGPSPLTEAIQALSPSQRARLLQELPEHSFSESLVRLLVGDSSELYGKLLRRAEVSRCHLAPLTGTPPDENWSRLALLALEAGHTPRSVAMESLVQSEPFTPCVEHCSKWLVAFERLADSNRPSLREVARHGLDRAKEWADFTRREERIRKRTGYLRV